MTYVRMYKAISKHFVNITLSWFTLFRIQKYLAWKLTRLMMSKLHSFPFANVKGRLLSIFEFSIYTIFNSDLLIAISESIFCLIWLNRIIKILLVLRKMDNKCIHTVTMQHSIFFRYKVLHMFIICSTHVKLSLEHDPCYCMQLELYLQKLNKYLNQ